MNQEEFFDEKIIDMINQAEKEKSKDLQNENGLTKTDSENSMYSIYSGVKVKGKIYEFERKILANDTISMMAPVLFEQMSLEKAKVKYPSDHRPETILTNDIGTVNLLFQYMEGDVPNQDIEAFRNQIFATMRRVNPGIKEKEIGLLDVSGKNVAYVEFTNPTLDGKLDNLMFYISVDDTPLMGSFNCQTKEARYWRDAFFEMIKSIEIV